MGIKLNPFTGQFDIAGGSEGESVLLYPSFSNFPPANSLNPGSLALALDTNILYVTDGSAWVAIGGPDLFANKSLSNLTTTAINESLVADTDNALDLGSASAAWKDLYANGQIKNTSSAVAPLTINDVAGTGYALQSSLGNTQVDSSGFTTSGSYGTFQLSTNPTSGMTYSGIGGFLTVAQNSTGISIGGVVGSMAINSTGFSLITPGNGSLTSSSASGVSLTSSIATGNRSLSLNSGGFSVSNISSSMFLSGTFFAAGGAAFGSLNLASTGFVVSGPQVGSATGGSFSANSGGFAMTSSLGQIALSSTGITLTSTTASSNVSITPGAGGFVSVNSSQVKDLLDPTDAQDAATKYYVDSLVSGLHWEAPVKALANVDVPLTGSTPLVIDGYTVLDTDRVILNNQTTPSEIGVYTASITGPSYTLTPVVPAANVGEAFLVLKGTVYANTAFVYTDTGVFVQFSSINAYTAGPGLQLTGSQFSVKLETTNPTLQVTSGELGLKIKPSGGLEATSTGVGVVGFVSSDIQLTSFSAAASQTNQPVTGLSFSNVAVRAFTSIVSVSTASGLYESFTLNGVQKTSGWEMTVSSVGDTSDYTFSINSSGQVLYSSPGTTATIKFRALVTTV